MKDSYFAQSITFLRYICLFLNMKFGKEIHQANFLILTPFTIKCDIVACVTTIFCHKCFVFKEGKDVCQEK